VVAQEEQRKNKIKIRGKKLGIFAPIKEYSPRRAQRTQSIHIFEK
jgi:hypothetical protein